MKQTANKILLSLLVACMLGGVWSCKSKKDTVNSNVTKDWEFNNALDEVLQNELQYTNLYAKGNFEFKAGKSGRKASAVYKIIKDSIIQISIRVPLLGEAGCINLTPDSVVIIERINGQYVAEAYHDLEFMQSVDFNYYNIQAILTNRLFVPGEQTISANDYNRFKLSKTTDVLMLQTSGEPDIVYNFAVDATEKIVSVLAAKKDLNTSVQFTYSDFIQDSGQVYPTVIEGSFASPKYRLGFAVTYPSLEIDKKGLKVTTSIPKKYKKVTYDKLMESLFK